MQKAHPRPLVRLGRSVNWAIPSDVWQERPEVVAYTHDMRSLVALGLVVVFHNRTAGLTDAGRVWKEEADGEDEADGEG